MKKHPLIILFSCFSILGLAQNRNDAIIRNVKNYNHYKDILNSLTFTDIGQDNLSDIYPVASELTQAPIIEMEHTSFQAKEQFTKDYSIVDFGAIGDGITVNTESFQKAIDQAYTAGGGRVIVPTGNFVSGTIILKDHVELHLNHGATIYGSKDLKDYLEIKPKYVALRTKVKTRQLIYAEDQENIAITGTGTIDGQGAAFEKKGSGDEGIGRPHLLQFINCKRVRIHDISMKNSGAWMQHYLACEDLKVHGIEVFNHANYNNDGLDIDGCKNVTVSGVTIDSDDDGICLKSTSGRPSSNISISNCVISSHCNALKMGTESSGGFQNISISNCVVKPSDVSDKKIYGVIEGLSGVSLEVVDGGVLKGVNISNIQIDGTYSPIFVRLGNRARPYSDQQKEIGVGSLSNVNISDIAVTNAKDYGCSISGLANDPVSDISLSNISIEMIGGGTENQFKRSVPEQEKSYPEATMFGKLPAYGFFVRHAKQIRMTNIHFKTLHADMRPAVFLSDVHQSIFNNLTFDNLKGKAEPIFVNESSDIRFIDCSPFADAQEKVFKTQNSENILWKK